MMKKWFANIQWQQGVLFLGVGLLLGFWWFGGSGVSHDHDHTSPQTGEATIWTCAMHPQIRQTEPGQCPICGMALTPAVAENGAGDPARLEMTAAAVALANIQTLRVGSQAGQRELLLNGKVRLNERSLFSQVSHLSGRIEQLYINSEGESVRQGQKIALLYAPELISAQQELFEALKIEDRIPELAVAAKSKLRQWKLSEAQIEEIARSGKIQQNVVLYAESSGVVLDRKVALGDYVRAGQPLLEIGRLDRLWVEFAAYSDDLPFVKVGDKIRFRLGDRDYEERISYIDPILDPATRTANLRVEIPNPGGRLKPDMFTQGKLQSAPDKRDAQLTVPQSAVLWTGKRSLVYVQDPIEEAPAFMAREVVLGAKLGTDYQIESGLAAGERVVVHGTFMVDAAAQLNDKRSMMNTHISVAAAPAVPDKPASFTVSEAFQAQLNATTDAYLALKNALVASDSVAVKRWGQTFSEKLQAVDMGQLSEPAHTAWMQLLSPLQQQASTLSEHSGLEAQRQTFVRLSLHWISVSQQFGHPADTLYVQFCPMANQDKGAFWLSNEALVRNPYYGDAMLRCGQVEETIEP